MTINKYLINANNFDINNSNIIFNLNLSENIEKLVNEKNKEIDVTSNQEIGKFFVLSKDFFIDNINALYKNNYKMLDYIIIDKEKQNFISNKNISKKR